MSSLPSRIAAALAVPWQTSYTAPALMALSGVAYALRGYEVRWSEPGVYADPRDGHPDRSPAVLTYACFGLQFGERLRTHGVEVSCVFPRAMVLAECRVRNWTMRRRAAARAQ